MNDNYERELEAEIDARLRELGELTAPATLAPRVMRTIERRSVRPWYRQSWDTWPVALRAASFAGLLVLFAGLCFGAWQVAHGGAGQGSVSFGSWVAGAGALWRTLVLLANLPAEIVGPLGMQVAGFGIAMIFMAWVVCIGLGTVYVRLAMRPAANRIEL
jgi:hypothetical protein